jgi:putative PEP-CTERM system histidine kinase
LSRSWPTELFALQGLALALSAPLFAFSVMQNRNFSFSLSRSATFQSVSLFTMGGYLVGMVLITSALEFIGGERARIAQIGFVFTATMIALVLAPAPRFRAWFRVKVSKHFFQHRYDYRSEWLRFTDTLGQPGDDAEALNVRVVQAIADIVESPSGVLLVPDAQSALLPKAHWNWSLESPPSMAGAAPLTHYLEQSGRVIDCDTLRRSNMDAADEDELDLVPQWIMDEEQIWSLVPLVHFGQLAGVIVLTRPYLSRTLDWEDFDLLRTAGRQVASYLAEARGQDELAEARRFDEFNRRFAFIMHDVKNLVSQLTLLTRNAERHADNPEFRADMIETLRNSTARMNALLARLSQHNKGRREEPVAMVVGDVARRVVAAKKNAHPVVATGDFMMQAIADPARLEQALGHLVQNAIEASPALEPVTIRLQHSCNEALIEVIDKGSGMSAAFIHDQLFKPFTSTKEGGFGIGTFEARAEILSMGGTLDVRSEQGVGTTFSIHLPLAGELTNPTINPTIEARELAA